MTTLANNQPRTYQIAEQEEYPVVAADIIFEGAAVGENASGYARPLVAADKFLGFAVEKADNSLGVAGGERIAVKTKGRIVLPVVESSITSNNRPAVYASDDNTFTLTSSGNSKIGYVSRWVSGTQCVVEFDARGI